MKSMKMKKGEIMINCDLRREISQLSNGQHIQKIEAHSKIKKEIN